MGKKIVTNSLKNLKVKKLECLLLHDSNVLLSKDGDEIYKSIINMKTSNFTKKIGISIYDYNLLDKILKKFKFDLIQAPLNIFDQRLINTGWLKKLKRKKMEVHVRSIFLQGILLLKPNQLPKRLKKLSKYWIAWEEWLNKNKLSSLQVCLSFILKQPELDGVIIGYNNKDHLKKILNLKSIKTKINFSDLNLIIKNKNLIDPRKWSN